MKVDPSAPAFLEAVSEVVLDASLAVQHLFTSRDFRVASKGEEGPVSSADLLANSILQRGLCALLPEAGWLSEESADSGARLEREYVWIVDPIDGTREFVKGVPEYSVSVGLSRAGEPVLGAVALPADRRIVYGQRELGVRSLRHSGPSESDSYFSSELARVLAAAEPAALVSFLDANPEAAVRAPGFESAGKEKKSEPVSFSKRTELKGAGVLISATENRRGKFEAFRDQFDLRPSGSIARKLALLAAGEGDLNLSLFPKNEWDICGGVALVRAWPGATVIDLEEFAPVRFNSRDPRSYGLAAGPQELVAAFAEHFRSTNIELERTY